MSLEHSPARQRKQRPPRTQAELDAAESFTISEFCARHRISKGAFYKNPPRIMNIGAAVRITRAAEIAWENDNEQAALDRPAPDKSKAIKASVEARAKKKAEQATA